jgi:hypothetical protein
MTVIATFKRGLEDPISYLNLMGTGEVRKLDEQDREACRHAARFIGYRFAPVQVTHPAAIHLSKDVLPRTCLKIVWRNLGSAPCYEQLAIELTLCSSDGKEVCRLVEMPSRPTTRWLPNEDVPTSFAFPLPPDLAAGDYLLKVALVYPFDEAKRILLPLKNMDEKRRYPLATITAKPREVPLPQPNIPGGDFEGENPLKGWWFPKGMTASVVVEDVPQGKKCLRLEGKSETGWNYAGAPSISLLPAAEYRLRGRMKVIEVDGVSKPVFSGRGGGSHFWEKAPYFKIGLVDAEGKWFTNHSTQRYDATKMGTWQELECKFVTDGRTGGGHFAVEKGGNIPRQAILLIDDIHLDLLSAP